MPNPHHLTIVGAGNVGLWAAINLVPRIRQEPGATWRIVVIDPDQATDRDHLKGMHASFCDGSLNKAVALKRFLTHAFGEDVGDVIVPVAAHAESVPGLLRLGPTLIGTDSFGSAAFSSAAASLGGVWQARLSTGKQDDAETWRVAVYPPGSGTLADGYDDAAWSRSREVASCVTGELLDREAGSAFPPGGLVGSLATLAWSRREREPAPYTAEVLQGVPGRVQRRASGATSVPLRSVPRAASATLGRLGLWVGEQTGREPQSLTARPEVPVVRRQCGCGQRIGFERYPIGSCVRCGRPSTLLETLGGLPLGPMEPGDGPLIDLGVPVGLAFEVLAGTVPLGRFQLPVGPTPIPGPEGGDPVPLPSALTSPSLEAPCTI